MILVQSELNSSNTITKLQMLILTEGIVILFALQPIQTKVFGPGDGRNRLLN